MLASSIEYGEAFRVRRFNLSGHRIYVVIANWEPVEFVQSVRHSIAYEAGLHRLASTVLPSSVTTDTPKILRSTLPPVLSTATRI